MDVIVMDVIVVVLAVAVAVFFRGIFALQEFVQRVLMIQLLSKLLLLIIRPLPGQIDVILVIHLLLVILAVFAMPCIQHSTQYWCGDGLWLVYIVGG